MTKSDETRISRQKLRRELAEDSVRMIKKQLDDMTAQAEASENSVADMIARAEAAEAQRDELAAQLATVTAQYATLQEMYRNDHDQRIRQEEQIRRLQTELLIEAHQSAAMQNEINFLEWDQTSRAFERTAPLDWRSEFNAETPLGQMLDGLGDEVEP